MLYHWDVENGTDKKRKEKSIKWCEAFEYRKVDNVDRQIKICFYWRYPISFENILFIDERVGDK